MAAGFFAKLWDKFKKIRSSQKPENQKWLKFAAEQAKNDVPPGYRTIQKFKELEKRLQKERLEKEANGKIGLANPFA